MNRVYLENKYRSAGEVTLADFVAKSFGRASDFGDWLGALDRVDLAPRGRALLMQDLRMTLTSMSSTSGFACT